MCLRELQTGANWELSDKIFFPSEKADSLIPNYFAKTSVLVTFMRWVLTGFMPDFMAPSQL